MLPHNFLAELEAVGPTVQMDGISLLLRAASPDLNLGLRLIIAHHRHSHGISVSLIQVAGQFHLFHIGVLSLLHLVKQSQQFHLPGHESRRRVCQIAPGLPAVGEQNQPPGPFRRDHGQRPGYSLLKIGGRLVRQRHNLCEMLFPGKKLLHHRIFSKGDNAILIFPGHLLHSAA